MNWEKLLSAKRLRKSTRDSSQDARNEYESDFGRLIFSPATRRMHDKTQVFPLTSDDNIHSRLTHSLEVMAIGFSLGLRVLESDEFIKRVGKDKLFLTRSIPTLLKNVCLVHDIGNSPFGHFGETVISEYFKNLFNEKNNGYNFDLTEDEKNDFMLFDGNAQGFRILTKLQILQDIHGLNLTCATLASYLKYPNFSNIDKSKLHTKKRGVFLSEKERFLEVARECGLEKDKGFIRHPLAYLMEAADSICYLVMDIEDGYNKNLYDFETLADLCQKGITDEDTFKNIFESSKSVTGKNIKNTRITKLRISLIDYLVKLAQDNFLKNIESIESGEYNFELIKDDPNKVAATLNDICFRNIFQKREVESLELTGHAVITGLLDYYIQFLFKSSEDYKRRALDLLSHSIKFTALLENGTDDFDNLSDYYKLRIIVDFISGMTDQFALKHYQKLSGQKII